MFTFFSSQKQLPLWLFFLLSWTILWWEKWVVVVRPSPPPQSPEYSSNGPLIISVRSLSGCVQVSAFVWAGQRPDRFGTAFTRQLWVAHVHARKGTGSSVGVGACPFFFLSLLSDLFLCALVFGLLEWLCEVVGSFGTGVTGNSWPFVWMFGIEPGSSGRIGNTLHHWAIPPTQWYVLLTTEPSSLLHHHHLESVFSCRNSLVSVSISTSLFSVPKQMMN